MSEREGTEAQKERERENNERIASEKTRDEGAIYEWMPQGTQPVPDIVFGSLPFGLVSLKLVLYSACSTWRE